jgi:uncharacterized protein
MKIQRSLYAILEKRLSSVQPFIQIITGPRQVGKSTAIKQIIQKSPETSMYVPLDTSGNTGLETITFNWNLARENKGITLLVFDEIQNVSGWARVIKLLFDEDRDKKKFNVVILGSSALELALSGDESLLGRFELIRTFHWNFSETNELKQTSLTKYLQYGGYPLLSEMLHSEGTVDLQRCQSFVRDAIIEPVITRDILSFKAQLNAALLRQTMQIALSLPCEEISFTKILGQLNDKGNTTTVKGYLELLEKAFLIKLLYRYTEGKISLRTSSPKIVPLAPALVHAYTSARKIEDDPSWFGKIFEMAIANRFYEHGFDLFYWKEGRHDVDLVAKKNDDVYAFEIKSGYNPDWKGLKAFKTKYPHSRIMLIDRTLGEKIIMGQDPLSVF